MFGFPKIEIRVFLAAHTYARRVGPNIADLAPIGDGQALAVFVDEHGLVFDAVDFEMVRRVEVADGFEVGARKSLIVEHAHGGLVACQVDELVVGGFERGLVVAGARELTAD